MRRTFLVFLFIFTGTTLMASSVDLHTVSHVDLPRYMGRWYVIANIPYFLERGKVASYDSYALREDGTLSNDLTFRKGTFDAPEKTWHGKAEVVNKLTNAEWSVQFIWPLSATYLILELDPEYQWSIVGTPGGKLVWILSRTRHIPALLYKDLIARVRTRGYNVEELVEVPQPAE